MIHHRQHKKGFTLVELSLAMAFLAVLLITIAILVIRIITIYQNGLAIRAVSSSGRQLIDDFTRSISGSPIQDVNFTAADSALTGQLSRSAELTFRYYFQKTGPIEVDGTMRDAPLAGGFCTGLYSYLWNTGYAINNNKDASGNFLGDENFEGFTYTYEDDSGTSIDLSDFRLIRVPDSGRELCIDQRIEDGEINPSHTSFAAPAGQLNTPPIELLGSAEDNLALYDLRIFPASSSQITGHIFYSGTFILATLRGGVDIFTTANYCSADYSTTLNTDFNYCAINKFNFAMRATGETKTAPDYGQRGIE